VPQYQKDFHNPDRLIRVSPLPLIGNASLPGCSKDSLPAAEGCVNGTNGRAGSGEQAPREWGLAFWSRLAVSCHHTADAVPSNRLAAASSSWDG
jgi:hypothetical protein